MVPPYLLGETYCYEVDSVPEAELEQVWDIVVAWYKRPLDDKWSKSLLRMHKPRINRGICSHEVGGLG